MKNELFKQGATWVRADFHLHTKTDKEFAYAGKEDYYYSAYASALDDTGIRVGVIANHNTFDFGEFKALRKAAKGKGIALLPGVELSVNDGASGIHVLVVFSDEWLDKGQDRISPFIASMFPGKAADAYQNENGIVEKNILCFVADLDKTKMDYFLVFAHVEDSKGLWHEMSGGKLKEWKELGYKSVRERTLGFQKVRTRDLKAKVKEWFGSWYPAEVEGSDPKSIEDIGKGRSCFLKLGALSFEAIKFALFDCGNRVSSKAPEISHSHIRSVAFTGGLLDGQTFNFSPELNTIIGIRGSGKSSILESLRYALEIPLDDTTTDFKYKQKLVNRTLESGGKVSIAARDSHQRLCQIERILNGTASVFCEGEGRPGVSIRETVLRNPLFFGQKELAAAGEGSEKRLIEKLLGSKCDDVRKKIAEQNTRIAETIDRLNKEETVSEQIDEQTRIKQDAEFRLDYYKKHSLDEKLKKRLSFDADIKKAEEAVSLLDALISDIGELLFKHEDDIRNYAGYASSENPEFFKDFNNLFSQAGRCLDSFKTELHTMESLRVLLDERLKELTAKRTALSDEFAAIERSLAEELKTDAKQNISPNEFLALSKRVSNAEAILASLRKSQNQDEELQKILESQLAELQDFWREEYQIINDELKKVSQSNSSLKFTADYLKDKDAFLEFTKNVFRGSSIRDTTYQGIVDKYDEYISLYLSIHSGEELLASCPERFIEVFGSNLKELLCYQPPNKYSILFHEKELSQHSLGQQASALILFVLSQQENDVIIIDQPEDDLDNQTIYEDVIVLLRRLKPTMQFIFATHNPNFPVLGDAEQIHVCSSDDHRISIESGGLDSPHMQKQIVDIMEGGKEAFKRRKDTYQQWKL